MNHYMAFVSHRPTFGWLSATGWVGVDLFFVLSGYLIGNQLFGGLARGEQLLPASFYARRILRTWPAFWVVLAALTPTSSLYRWRIPGAYHVALWSYSTYLSHKAVFNMVEAYLAQHHLSAASMLILGTLASAICGAVLYRLAEFPFLALRDRRFPTLFRKPFRGAEAVPLPVDGGHSIEVPRSRSRTELEPDLCHVGPASDRARSTFRSERLSPIEAIAPKRFHLRANTPDPPSPDRISRATARRARRCGVAPILDRLESRSANIVATNKARPAAIMTLAAFFLVGLLATTVGVAADSPVRTAAEPHMSMDPVRVRRCQMTFLAASASTSASERPALALSTSRVCAPSTGGAVR